MNYLRTLTCLGLVALAATPVHADLKSDLAFTGFAGVDVDVNAMANGTIMQARGPIMTFPRGITSQSLFIIDAQPADVAKKLAEWNPQKHSELKVWLHKSLPAQPKPSDFADLASVPDNKSVQFQIDATAKFDPSKPELQLSKEDAQIITATAAQEKDPKQLFAKAWGQILSNRIANFFAGKAGADTVMGAGGDVHSLNDVKSLLHSDLKVYGNYQNLLNQTPVKALAGGSSARLKPIDIYCDMFDVQGAAALGTGVTYQAPSGNSIQSFDVEYFTNYGVYCTIELEQMWPVTVNGKTETLVWREDLVSAPNVAYLHGTERLASSMIMLQETKGGVQAFKDEFK